MATELSTLKTAAGAKLHARAPAKVNLALAVSGRRDDGYHEITSLVVGIELFDELQFDRLESGIELVCDEPGLPSGRENLVVRAAEALVARCPWGQGVRVRLEKRIPLASGLGGGSSDAALTLRALNELWNLGVPRRELAAIGAELGSDVPLFFALPSAVIKGRGEQVTAASLAWRGWVVLVFGPEPVSTLETYKHWTPGDHRGSQDEVIDRICAARSAAEMMPLLFNELEPAIYRTAPAVEDYHRRLLENSGRVWRLSGAGATAFALFDEEPEARRAAEWAESEKLGRGVAVVRTVTGSMENYLRSDEPWRFPRPA